MGKWKKVVNNMTISFLVTWCYRWGGWFLHSRFIIFDRIIWLWWWRRWSWIISQRGWLYQVEILGRRCLFLWSIWTCSWRMITPRITTIFLCCWPKSTLRNGAALTSKLTRYKGEHSWVGLCVFLLCMRHLWVCVCVCVGESEREQR